MKFKTIHPILRVPAYTDEGVAVGRPIKPVPQYVKEIKKKIEEGTLVQPIRIDSTGRGLAIADWLDKDRIKVVLFRITTL